MAQSYPVYYLRILHVQESATIPIKPGRNLISKIVAGRQLIFIGQADFVEHPAEINELTHFCIRTS